MAHVKSGIALGTEILAALGVDKTGVRKLMLMCNSDDVAVLVVEHVVVADNGEIGSILKRYKLTEAD